MNNLKNIDSIPDPRKKRAEDDAVNPDKFQKALKVDKSEETDKREKRNRPKKEEELEDEVDDVGASIPVPTGLFKEYMTEDEKKASILDASSGSKPHMVADKKAATSAPLGYIPEVKDDTPSSKLSIGVTDSTSSAANPSENDDDDLLFTPPSGLGSDDSEGTIGDDIPSPPAAAPEDPPETPAPPTEQQNINQNAPTAPLEGNQQEMPDTENNTDNSNTSSINRESQPETSSKSSTKEKEKKKQIEKASKKKTTKSGEKETTALKAKDKKEQPIGTSSKTATEKEGPRAKEAIKETGQSKAKKSLKKTDATENEKTTPLGTTKNADTKGTKEASPVEESDSKNDDDIAISATTTLSDKGHDHHDDSSNKEGNDEEVVGTLATVGNIPAGVPALQMSPFANIPKDVFELFEKMVGMMQVSKDNGKSITTVKLNMPGSTFDKCELILEHYDTAPNNYNVQFLGNPDAVNRFTQNLAGLDGVIKNNKLNFSINLLPPKLNKNYSSAVTGIEKEKGDKEEKDGEQTDK